MNNSPQILYTPAVREPLSLRRKTYILPAPPPPTKRPEKITWQEVLLSTLILVIVLDIIASVTQSSIMVFSIVLPSVYFVIRIIVQKVQIKNYNSKEAEREETYKLALEKADREIASYLREQRDFLKHEFLPTEGIYKLAEARGKARNLWYRTNTAIDFMALRIGVYTGKPLFVVETPKEDIEGGDPLFTMARYLKERYQISDGIPYFLNLKELGSVAFIGDEEVRYGLVRRALLDTLVHHRPDEVKVYVLSNHQNAMDLWGWLQTTPHCKSRDDYQASDHLIIGSKAIKTFLGRFKNEDLKNPRVEHLVFVIDMNDIQRYDNHFITALASKAIEWNISVIFVGGEVPRSVRGIVRIKNSHTCLLVDTRTGILGKVGNENHPLVSMDELPGLEMCNRVSNALAEVKLSGGITESLLPTYISLLEVLGIEKNKNLTSEDVIHNWSDGEGKLKIFAEKDLLQLPIGLVEGDWKSIPYCLNLLESRFGGMDAYHTMLIGTTGSGKSDFIKSLILGAAFKYPPQYLTFFCMDFKGGSTYEQLEKLPHVIGKTTIRDEAQAQRSLFAIMFEIEKRQNEFIKANVKDIWEFNLEKPITERMPHLVLVLDEFTLGMEILDTPEFNLQDLLQKRLFPQGRSLGIYMLLANQVVNAKVTKFLPYTGWRIALRVASQEQMLFINPNLKPSKYAGRGYIQVTGEDPVEFQSGYSSSLVQTDSGVDNHNGEYSPYLESHQVIDSVTLAVAKMKIGEIRKIYLPPLPNSIDLNNVIDERRIYRYYSDGGWSSSKNNENLLQVPIGMIDLVKSRDQRPLVLDFLNTNSNLLIAGSQLDIIAGMRTILFSLFFSHSSSDVHVYMLEFGEGLKDIPCFPHVGTIVDGRENDRAAAVVSFFENEFSNRKKLFGSEKDMLNTSLPQLFLVINNIAEMVNYFNLYQKIMRLMTLESFKFGVHIIFTVLPRTAGIRIPSADLKTIASKIVFPSIKSDDYWRYFDVSERKLVKLTEKNPQQNEDAGQVTISRAYWLCVNDPQIKEPVELQLALPRINERADEFFATQMSNFGIYNGPFKYDVLEKRYLSEKDTLNNSKNTKPSIPQKHHLRVFLCHTKADKPIVRELYKKLVADGVDVWLDEENLTPGQNWRIEIQKAVRQSDVVIICLSNNSVTKEGYVQTEIKFALDLAKEKPENTIYIVPVRLEECNPPAGLADLQWADLFFDGEKFEDFGYRKLSHALQKRAEVVKNERLSQNK